MKALEPDIRKLELRLNAGIKSGLCWQRFVEDSGSELIDRTTRIFVDGITAGGDADEIGGGASFFAQQIVLLREKRSLVSGSFNYLVPLLHASIVGLMVFIVNVMRLFTTQLNTVATETADGAEGATGSIPSLGLSSFSTLDLDFLGVLVTFVVLTLTVANGFVMSVVGGGHWLKMTYSFAILMFITGLMLAMIPGLSESVFATIAERPD
jgi:flagellar protein FlaJ